MEIKLHKMAIDDRGFHLLLDASIEGNALKLVLDTGASQTVVDYEFLKHLIAEDAFKLQEDFSVGVGSNQINSYLVSIKKMQIANLSLENYSLATMDLSHVHQTYAQLDYPDVFGVLGGDILEKYNALIDYKNNVLRLED